MRRLLAAALLLGGLLLGGCTATPQPAPTDTPQASSSAGLITPLSVTRWGEPGGHWQSLSIAADGSWVYTTDPQAGITKRGRLTPAQLNIMVKLLTDPALLTVLANPPTDEPIICTDGQQYRLQFGTSDTFSFLDCGSLPPPVEAVMQELFADTPF